MRKTFLVLLIPAFFLSFCNQAEALTSYFAELDSNGKVKTYVVTTTTINGRVYLDTKTLDIPFYDIPTGEYRVPAIQGEELEVPDPAASAQGDTTPKKVIVGNPVILKIPGTDLIKLADGTWTNTQPSPTLSGAAESTKAVTAATYDARPLFVLSGTLIQGTFYSYNPSPITPVWDSTYYAGTFIPKYIPGEDLESAITAPYYVDTRFELTGAFYEITALGTNTNISFTSCASNGRPANVWYGTRGSSSMTYCRDGQIGTYPTASRYWTISGGNGVTFDSAKYSPGQNGETTPQELGEELSPEQPNWKSNGLDNDYKEAAKNGNPTIEGAPPTPEEIQNWKDANGTAVKDAIKENIKQGYTISTTDGSGTGAQQQTSGLLSGILDTLNGIKDSLTTDGTGDDPNTAELQGISGTLDGLKNSFDELKNALNTEYLPPAASPPYEQEKDVVDFGERLDSFVSNLKSSSIFGLPNSAFNVPGGGSSQLSINGGQTFGIHTFDLADMSNLWSILRSIVLVSFSLVAVRIVCLKGGSQ